MSHLKLKHYDAGLGNRLRKYQDECPSLHNNEVFTRFLEALGQHMSQSVHHDSGSHPWLNWWTGSDVHYFWNSGHQAAFDENGRQKLAKNLAERTFKLVRLHRTLGDSKYLGKRCYSDAIEEDHRETTIPEDLSSTCSKSKRSMDEAKTREKSTATEVEHWQPLASLTKEQHL